MFANNGNHFRRHRHRDPEVTASPNTNLAHPHGNHNHSHYRNPGGKDRKRDKMFKRRDSLEVLNSNTNTNAVQP